MSGGALDYGHMKIGSIAEQLAEIAENETQKEFAKFLLEVAKATKDIEWHLSGDTNDPEPESVVNMLEKSYKMKNLLAIGEGKSEKFAIVDRRFLEEEYVV